MANGQGNLQDSFLNNVRKENISVVIYLLNGTQIRGNVKGFDSFTILLETNGKLQLVYKHAVSSILPAKHPGSLHTPSSRSAGK